jgi:hypothetical protein
MLIGWLSPEGEFFPCDSFSHSSKAEEIVEQKYCGQLSVYSYYHDDFLFSKGWASLSYDYFFFFTFHSRNTKNKPTKFTDAQVKFVGRNAAQFTNKQRKDISDLFELQSLINKRGGFHEQASEKEE